MKLKHDRNKEVKDALDLETRPLFPAIYEGCIEADALAQGEDEILRVLRNAVYRYFQNRNLQTLNEEAAYALESGLGLAHSGTIEERRAVIIEAVNKRFVFNDAELAARIKQMAHGEDVRFRVDQKALTLEIWTEGRENDGEFVAYDITQALKPVIPQNIQLYAELYAEPAAIDEHMTVGTVCAIATSIETETVNNDPSQYEGVFLIWLESNGKAKSNVIKALRKALGLGLKEAKEKAEAAPTEIARYKNRLDAESVFEIMQNTKYDGKALRDTDAVIYIMEEK